MMKKTPYALKKNILVASALASALALAGCGSILPPMSDFKVTNIGATPTELMQNNLDPIDTGAAQPFQPPAFFPVELSSPQADTAFGLGINPDSGAAYARTQNTNQLLVNGRRLVDPQGKITNWSPIANTGFITYLVQDDRVGQTIDHFSHYDLKLLDVRTPGKKPQKIASLATNGFKHLWQFGNDKTQQQAERYMLTSRGVVALREEGTVITYYEAGKAPVTTALPVGFKATAFGVTSDFAYSQHIRVIQHRGVHKLFGILPSAQEELYDVGYWNMVQGNMTMIANDLVVNTMNETAFQNYVSGKAQMSDSASGPLVVTVEDTLKKTVARNLATLQKVTLVQTERKQGHEFSSGLELRPNGGVGKYHKVWVEFSIANGDMSNTKIVDLEAWMNRKASDKVVGR